MKKGIDMNKEEMDLVIGLRERNEKALYLLIDIYGGLIKSIIHKHVQQPDACDECMDDILFSIWNNIDRYNEKKNSFKNWVVAVSKYKSIDQQRKYYRVLKKYQLEDKDINEFTDAANQINDDISIEMERLLAHLNQNDKELFIKHYVNESSVDEIAEEMGVKQSWIYNRLSRARRKLRAVYKDVNHD